MRLLLADVGLGSTKGSEAMRTLVGILEGLTLHQSEGGSPERLIPSLGVESGLAGRIFVFFFFFFCFLFAGPGPCLNNRHAAGTRRPRTTP